MMVVIRSNKQIPATPRRQLNFAIPERFYDALAVEAKKLDMAPSRYAQTLFEAAWSARHGKSGDPILESVVGAALVLWSLDYDTQTIAANLNLEIAQVETLIARWQSRDRRDRQAA